jgi:hypothetical protein
MRVGATAAFIALAVTIGGGQQPGGGIPPATGPNVARDLRGTIDIHVHSDPDSMQRTIDGLDAAKAAQQAGMRGIVLKNHFDPTAGLAFLARKTAPKLEVFGGIDLNLPVGGMNAIAVEHMTQVAGHWGRLVWMSTFDAENQVRGRPNVPFVRVSQNGQLLPETKAVIAVIAKHNLVLASGHVSAQEALLMFEEGKRQGVQHMVATHGTAPPTSLMIDQAKQATALGVYIEFCGGTLEPAGSQARIDRFAQQIRELGIEHVILSSDLGEVGKPLPVPGFATYLEALRKKGFTNQELDRMSKQNPATLLGLD